MICSATRVLSSGPRGVVPVRQIVDVAEEVGDQHGPRDVGAVQPLVLPALDQRGELVVVLAPPTDDLLLPGLGQHVLAAEEHGALGEELDRRLDDVDAGGAQDIVDRRRRAR